MEKRVIVSGGDELREILLPAGTAGRRIRMEGAGALCCASGQIFCACSWGDVIWRLDDAMLVPTALFAGGPGICQLCVLGERLYALCADADSMLLLHAGSGAPLLVNRVGVNPRAMALDETGEVLAVAGGECGEVVLLCAHTLRVFRRLPMPGIVCGVALSGGSVYALCLNETMTSTLVTVRPGGVRRTLSLRGMPGTLLIGDGVLLAATYGHLYTLPLHGARVLSVRSTAGQACRMCAAGHTLLLCDPLGEAVFAMSMPSGCFQLVCEHARDLAHIPMKKPPS